MVLKLINIDLNKGAKSKLQKYIYKKMKYKIYQKLFISYDTKHLQIVNQF